MKTKKNNLYRLIYQIERIIKSKQACFCVHQARILNYENIYHLI